MGALISEVLGYLADFAQYAQKLFGSAGFPKLNYGWLVALFLVFVVLLVGLSLGKSRLLLSLICLYITSFLESHFIYFDKLRELLKNPPEFRLHIGLFLVIFIICLAILNRSALKQSLTLRETSFFPIILIALVGIGFLISLIVSFPSPGTSENWPAWVVRFFGTKNAQFWWALAPLILLLFMKRKKESPKI